MVYETIAFSLFALVTVGCSLGVVLVRDIWHSALLLGGALLSVAVHYVMLQAEFLAAMQILHPHYVRRDADAYATGLGGE
jgi:NADH-quinone oxidoreductase subunit J